MKKAALLIVSSVKSDDYNRGSFSITSVHWHTEALQNERTTS
ncbi:hypothetical protein [Vallitalea pronyensis]|nr:hypothetical protein [Vallitalea pronyensis]